MAKKIITQEILQIGNIVGQSQCKPEGTSARRVSPQVLGAGAGLGHTDRLLDSQPPFSHQTAPNELRAGPAQVSLTHHTR